MNFNSEYLTDQIITYLGNKRRLIDFIDQTVEKIISDDEELNKKKHEDITFFDIFSGSGIVSRYANQKGFSVLSNDLELYSKIINETMINTNLSVANRSFLNAIKNLNKRFNLSLNENENQAYATVISYLNSREKPLNEESYYFSKHYAPKDTNNFDFEKERLFYTRENALFLDAVVEIIFDENLFEQKAREIILTSLMYLMTKNINTSGTMKGFHNGWGGKSSVALNRILAKMEIKPLPFIEGQGGLVYQNYAEKIFNTEKLSCIDIIYADPPYNQHQYSANYNHLTTICKNDKYDPGEVKKGSRAGIRVDHARSDFCKSVKNSNNIKMAEQAFIDFIQSIKCKYLIVSYNNEGVLDIDKLIDVLSDNLKNKISVKTKKYSKYKGGKVVSNSTSVLEYLLIIEMNNQQSEKEVEELKLFLKKGENTQKFLDSYFDPKTISNESIFLVSRNENKTLILKNDIEILTIDNKSYKVIKENSLSLNEEELSELYKSLMNKRQLIDQYILDENVLLAEKSVKTLNFSKLKDVLEEYTNKINKIKEKLKD